MISFIIPAYNAANTIKRAIDSILNQTAEIKYEIVIVDDGSTDDTKYAIEEYNQYPQIKYFKKENGGISSARNFGLRNAKGDYIIFVDSDDYISATLLEDIDKYIKQECDLIKWNAEIVNDEEIQKTVSNNNVIITTGEDAFNKLFGVEPLLDCLWNYAIKKELVLEFPEGRYHEDFLIMPQIILRAKKIAIMYNKEYYYVQTDESIMRNNNKGIKRKKLEDILINFDTLLEEIDKLDLSKTTKENVGIFAANSLLVIVPELEETDKEYFKNELRKRHISKLIKIRNPKQLLKRIYLKLKY